MQMVSVKSTNISQIGYEENAVVSMNKKPQNILKVVFTSGFTYDFYDVEKEVYESLLSADSVGKYFNQNIKNQYSYEKK